MRAELIASGLFVRDAFKYWRLVVLLKRVINQEDIKLGVKTYFKEDDQACIKSVFYPAGTELSRQVYFKFRLIMNSLIVEDVEVQNVSSNGNTADIFKKSLLCHVFRVNEIIINEIRLSRRAVKDLF